MELDSLHGLMVECTRASIMMIKSMGMESLVGLTEESMQDNGLTENSMVVVNIRAQREMLFKANGV
jgi:hypothetical protein